VCYVAGFSFSSRRYSSRRSAAKTDLSRRSAAKTDLSRRSAAKTDGDFILYIQVTAKNLIV
jgi:hypothetical protein